MRRALRAGCLVSSLLLAAVARAGDPPIARPADFTRRVDEAIHRGIAWLRSVERKEGGVADEIETAAIAYHALRICKVPGDDPFAVSVYSSLQSMYDEERKFNKDTDSHFGTDETGWMLKAIASHGTAQSAADTSGEPSFVLGAEDNAWMKDLVKFLEKSQKGNGEWPAYVDLVEPGDLDIGYTYAALLGLKAASRCGVAPPASVWTKSLQYFLGTQDAKGTTLPPETPGGKPRKARGWDLMNKKSSPDFEPTDWDTANAVTALAICRSELLNASKKPPSGDKTEQAIRDGLAFLGSDTFILDSLGNADAEVSGSYFADAYSIERACDLLGVERLGKLDWYAVGVDALLRRQGKSGAWHDQRRPKDAIEVELFRDDAIRATCWSLLFLARGTPRVRWTLTNELDDTDVNFAVAGSLLPRDFEDFVDLVLSRWRGAADPAVKDRLFAKTTAVGPRIVPPLLERMASEKAEVRASAFALLQRATSLDHGYDPAAEPEARAAAIARWNEWWTKNSASLRYDEKTGRLVAG